LLIWLYLKAPVYGINRHELDMPLDTSVVKFIMINLCPAAKDFDNYGVAH